MILNYFEAQWVYLLREEFGCTYSRIREIMCKIYPAHKFGAYTGKDIVGYAYILLGKPIPVDADESEIQSLTKTISESDHGDSYEE